MPAHCREGSSRGNAPTESEPGAGRPKARTQLAGYATRTAATRGYVHPCCVYRPAGADGEAAGRRNRAVGAQQQTPAAYTGYGRGKTGGRYAGCVQRVGATQDPAGNSRRRAAAAVRFQCSTSMASSMLPPVAASAFLQSIMPAPVLLRRSFTALAEGAAEREGGGGWREDCQRSCLASKQSTTRQPALQHTMKGACTRTQLHVEVNLQPATSNNHIACLLTHRPPRTRP